MKKSHFTHTDRRMHRVRCDVPTSCGRLLENVYEHYTLRTYRWRGISYWQAEIDVERRPIHEFIKRCI